ncbi:MAG: hypothetical protein WB626_02040 [Bacteroidota bacterium]
MRSGVSVLLLALLAAPGPVAGTPQGAGSVRARTDSSVFLIGDWITVHLHARHPAGWTLRPAFGDSAGRFAVIRHPEMRPMEDGSRGELVVAFYDSGRAVLPPLPFVCGAPGDTVGRTFLSDSLVFLVRAVEVDTSSPIKDLKPPLSLPLTLAEAAPVLAALLALAAAAWLASRWWKNRKGRPSEPAFVPPPRPAHVIALEELGLLKEKRLWQQGLVKQYYSELTEIARRYFENRFGFAALEQTTDEIMRALAASGGESPIASETERLLRMADLAKFARHRPGVAEHEEAMQIVYAIVERTTPPTHARR